MLPYPNSQLANHPYILQYQATDLIWLWQLGHFQSNYFLVKWKQDWSKFVFLVIQRRRNFAFETKLEGTRQVLGVSNREPLFLRKCRYQNSKQGSYSNDWWETTQRRLRQGKYKHKHKPIYAICTTCRLPQLQKCLMIFGHGCMNLGTISTLIIQLHFVKFK